ncbi:MAG: NFACT family protein [Oscillospiraceae bacterium]
MALDGAFLYCTLAEVRRRLTDARVDKIYQPAKDMIVIGFRGRGFSEKLLISAGASSARVQLTEQSFENPAQPPMFCMLLRKHLGGRLAAVRQDGLERAAYFDFECTNELGDLVTITVAAEIMGRRSNIVLINENGKVIDAIRRVDEDMSETRRILPGVTYIPPERQNKLNFLECSADEIIARIEASKPSELSKAIVDALEGISPLFARECAYFAGRGAEIFNTELTEEHRIRLSHYLCGAREAVLSGAPRTVIYDRDKRPKDFCFVPIKQYGTLMLEKTFDSESKLLDSFYSERDNQSRMKQRSHDLLKTISNLSERVSRRIENQKQELAQCKDRDRLKIAGDLINANIYRLEKGMRSAELENFYEEGSPAVTVELDPRLTPSQNAQRYYSKYRKADTAERLLKEQISLGQTELLYIDSVFDSLVRATSEAELAQIREELIKQGYVKRGRKNEKAPKALPPIKLVTSDGFTVLVGRSNVQNDRLTLKDSAKTDMWLHTHDIHGAHVIIRSDGREISKTAVEEAAVAAAYQSKARESSGVPVDYTLVRYVKKPAGAKPGMVVFTNNKTLYVTPDAEKYAQMLAKD